MTPVRIHTDRALVPAGAPHVALFDPLWGPGEDEDPHSPISGRFRAWRERGVGALALVPLAEADCVVLPAGWEHYAGRRDAEAGAAALAARAAGAGKPFVAFFVADSTAPLPLEHAHVLRPSLLRSTRGPREYAMPALSVDVRANDFGGELPLREWRETPVVGFCGFVAGGPRDRLRRRLRGLPEHPSTVRRRALRRLGRTPGVETNVVLRSAFWAGVLGAGGAVDYGRMRAARSEFAANLRDSDYLLSARGGGNFSYRLYEAMSAARIPLFVDTDCVLPFEDELDWRSLVAWVDAADLGDIGRRLLDFHAALGPGGFRERQRECRRVWEERLSPEGFYRSLLPRLASLPA